MSKPGDFFVATVSAVIAVLTLVNAMWPEQIRFKTPLILRLQEMIGEKWARVVLVGLAIFLITIALRLAFAT